jgi:hypothetical protein
VIYFEDLVVKAHELLDDGHAIGLSDWSRNFIQNVGAKLSSDDEPRLSTNQAQSLKKVLGYFVRHFVSAGFDRNEIEESLINPVFKAEPYVSPAVKRECRHLGANKLGFRFKFDPITAKKIQESATHGYYCRFDKKTKLWIVTVCMDNYPMIISMINECRFELNESTRKWLNSLDQIFSTDYQNTIKSSFVYDKNSNCVIANVCGNEALEEFIYNILEGIYI